MRTESEIQADIESLTADVNNLSSVATPLSGTNLLLQQISQKLSDAWKELAEARGSVAAPAEAEPAVA